MGRATEKHQQVWDYICKLSGRTFTRAEITRATDYQPNSCKHYLKQLTKAGILQHMPAIGRGNEERYQCTMQNLGIKAPKVKDGQLITLAPKHQRLWNALRTIATGTTKEMAIAASTDEDIVTESQATVYLRMLCQGGYVRKINDRWQVIKPRLSGPLAPEVVQIREVFDPNLGEIVARSGPRGFRRDAA